MKDGLPPKLSTGTVNVSGSDLVYTVTFRSDGTTTKYVITARHAVPGKALPAMITDDGADAGAITLAHVSS